VGVIGGMAMDRLVTDAIRHADLVIGFGLDTVEIDQTWHAEVPVSWILEAPSATGVVPDANVIACRQDELLEVLIRQGPPRTWSDSFDGFRKSRWPASKAEDAGHDGFLDPLLMISDLARVMPPEPTVVTDVGLHKYLFGRSGRAVCRTRSWSRMGCPLWATDCRLRSAPRWGANRPRFSWRLETAVSP
jgi:thiamine pyrophosphate-dependent acetolactate synthase large subunit-like protein